MRFLTRGLIGFGLLVAAIGLIIAAFLVISDALRVRAASDGRVLPTQERSFIASVLRVDGAQISPVLTAFGEVRAARSLELRSPGAGTVIWISDALRDGLTVTQGQPLLRLDPAAATTARDIAISDLSRAEAEAQEAIRTVAIARDELLAAQAQAALRAQAMARQQDLLARGIGSDVAMETAALAASSADQAVLSRRQAVSQAETNVALAETATARQRITLAEAGRDLANTELRAEFDGVLNGITLSQGGTLTQNERIGDLIDPGTLELSFRVSTTQFGPLIDGEGDLRPLALTATLASDAGALTASGRLSRVGAAVGEGQTGRLIYAALDGSPAFRPGDFVTVAVQEPALQNVALLPGTALGADGAVLALGPDDRLEAIPVTLLRRQGDQVLIDATPLAGREVVAERSPLLGAGIKLRPARGGENAETGGDALIALTDERRADLIAKVTANDDLPEADRSRLLDQLAQDRIPGAVILSIEQRAGG